MPITIHLEEEVFRFYCRVSEIAQLPLEQILSDALFKLAGELSLEALRKAE